MEGLLLTDTEAGKGDAVTMWGGGWSRGGLDIYIRSVQQAVKFLGLREMWIEDAGRFQSVQHTDCSRKPWSR